MDIDDLSILIIIFFSVLSICFWIVAMIYALRLPKGAKVRLYGKRSPEWTRESVALMAIFSILFGPLGLLISFPVFLACLWYENTDGQKEDPGKDLKNKLICERTSSPNFKNEIEQSLTELKTQWKQMTRNKPLPTRLQDFWENGLPELICNDLQTEEVVKKAENEIRKQVKQDSQGEDLGGKQDITQKYRTREITKQAEELIRQLQETFKEKESTEKSTES
jgi:hypothetical protein